MPPKKYDTIPMIVTSVRISPEFHELCYKHQIRFSEAMRVGISILLAEKGLGEYDNSLNLMRRLKSLQLQLEDISQKYHDLLEEKEIKEKLE